MLKSDRAKAASGMSVAASGLAMLGGGLSGLLALVSFVFGACSSEFSNVARGPGDNIGMGVLPAMLADGLGTFGVVGGAIFTLLAIVLLAASFGFGAAGVAFLRKPRPQPSADLVGTNEDPPEGRTP